MTGQAARLGRPVETSADSRVVAKGLETLALIITVLLLLCFLAPMADVPSLSADSGTALSVARALANGDTEPFVQGLFPPLQTFTYGVMFRFGIVGEATAVAVLCSLLFALTLSAISFVFSRSALLACIPIVVLFFSEVFWRQSAMLTFYPGFATLGVAGLFLACRYVLDERNGRLLGILGGLLLGASVYAFTTSILYLPIPGLLLACYWSRQRLGRAIVVYGAVAVLGLPWLAWHVWVGGTHFYYHPLNWFIENHLDVVNREFWRYPQQSLVEYGQRMVSVGFGELLPVPAWPLLLLGVAFVWKEHGPRGTLFLLGCAAFFIASLLVIRPSPFGRYFYPILPLAVLLVTAGVLSLVRNISLDQRPIIAMILLTMLITFAVVHPGPVVLAHRNYVERLDTSPSYKDMQAIVPLIDDHAGLISRDSVIQQLLPDNQVNTVFLMSEVDYVTYLSWPTDDQVLAAFSKYDIHWVLLYKDANKWERDYNVWLKEDFGIEPRHYLAIQDSPNFTKVYDGPIYVLYKRISQQADAQ